VLPNKDLIVLCRSKLRKVRLLGELSTIEELALLCTGFVVVSALDGPQLWLRMLDLVEMVLYVSTVQREVPA
jgi:hypothetical protein